MLVSPLKVGILGAGGFAKEVSWLISECNGIIPVCYIDKQPGPVLNGLPVIDIEHLPDNVRRVACGIGGTSKLRNKVIAQALGKKLIILRLIHPSVLNSAFIDIGEGTIICAGNIITTNVTIGKYCQINLACTIGHDCVIGDNVIVSPGCNISGKVKIGNGAYIGTGAKILENIDIGEDAVIGAGAVVTKSIPSGMVAVGIPAKVVKRRDEE